MKEIPFEILTFKLFSEHALTTFVHKSSLLDVKFTGHLTLSYFCGGFHSLYRDNSRAIVSGIFRVVHYGSKVIWDSPTVYHIICFFSEVFLCSWRKWGPVPLSISALYKAATWPLHACSKPFFQILHGYTIYLVTIFSQPSFPMLSCR